MSSWRFGDVQHSLSLSCYFILCLPLCGACLCSEVFPQKLCWCHHVQAAICRWSRLEWILLLENRNWEYVTQTDAFVVAQDVWYHKLSWLQMEGDAWVVRAGSFTREGRGMLRQNNKIFGTCYWVTLSWLNLCSVLSCSPSSLHFNVHTRFLAVLR